MDFYRMGGAGPVPTGQSANDRRGRTSRRRQVSPQPGGAPPELQAPSPIPAAPVIPAAPADGGVSNSGPPPAQPIGPVTPPMPAAPAPPVSPVASEDEDSGTSYHPGFSYTYAFDDEQRFVIVSGKSD